MAITKINTVLVKHSRILFGAITVIIIISFVWFFTPGTSGSIFFEKNGSPNAIVGKALGEKITLGMLENAQKDYAVFQGMMVGTTPALGRNFPLNQAFEFAVMQVYAKKLGITVTDAQVGELIRSAPVFQDKNGKFSPDKFMEYEKKTLNPANYNALDLDRAAKNILTADAVMRAVGMPTVTPGEIEAFQLTNMEKFNVRSVIFRTADYIKSVQPTAKELESYFNANRKQFKTTPRIQATVVRFPYNAYTAKVKVTDAEIKKYYDNHKSEFMKGGKVSPLNAVTAQIRTKLQTAAAKAMAEKTAYMFREKLYTVTGDLAGDKQSYIQAFDKVVAEQKLPVIKTGWFKQTDAVINNIGTEPALLNALAAAAIDRPITDPVTGVNAAYVAVVTNYEPARQATIKEAAGDVNKAFCATKALALSREAAGKFTAAMAASKNPAADLAKLAGKGIIKSYPQFEPLSASFKYPGLAQTPVIPLAMETRRGRISRPMDTPDGIMLVFVDKRTLPTKAEMEKDKMTCTIQYRYFKQQASSNSFISWISANTQNFIQER